MNFMSFMSRLKIHLIASYFKPLEGMEFKNHFYCLCCVFKSMQDKGGSRLLNSSVNKKWLNNRPSITGKC